MSAAAYPLPGPLSGVLVLVVEDDPPSLKLTSLLLKRAGARVSTAMTGEEALSAIFVARPDIAIIDLLLPTMDGLVLIETLRNSNTHRDIVCVAVSMLNGPRTVRLALDAGCSTYLRKPLDNETFATTVARILRDRR